nr:leucine-rich repeat domain-containing protein [Bacteroidota bacterium]
MKKQLLRLLFFIAIFFATNIAQAQYVTIPDPNFVAWLNANGYAGCMNGNMMDTTCGAVVNATSVNCFNKNIFDLTGIEYFDNLTSLICSHNQLISLPAFPIHLTYLDCYYNGLTTIPGLPDSLTNLFCGQNSLTNLPPLPNSLEELACMNNQFANLPALPSSLKYLWCNNNQLTSLPILPNFLIYLDCNSNQITNLPILPNSLTSLICNNNQLTNLPILNDTLSYLNFINNNVTTLPALPKYLTELLCFNNQITNMPSLPNSVTYISCGANQLTSLPLLPNSLTYLSCGGNQLTSLPTLPKSMTELWCGMNQLTSLPSLPDSFYFLHCSGNLNLYCLPKLNRIVNLVFSNTGIQCLPNYGNVTFSNPPLSTIPLCIPLNGNGCGVHWKMEGHVYLDTITNCIYDNGEQRLNNMKLLLIDTNNLVIQQTYTSGEGLYTFDSDTGYFKISVDTTNLQFLVSCPILNEYAIYILSIDSFYYNNDFAISCKSGFDIGASTVVIDSGIYRPANFANIKIFAGDMSNHYGLHCAKYKWCSANNYHRPGNVYRHC